ncbi:MAG: hypothetical protein ABIU05_20980 [Nitrospirales bacterium]
MTIEHGREGPGTLANVAKLSTKKAKEAPLRIYYKVTKNTEM